MSCAYDNPWGLSERHCQVLSAMCEAETLEQIAISFGIARQTLGEHLTAIFKIMGTSSRTKCAVMWDRWSRDKNIEIAPIQKRPYRYKYLRPIIESFFSQADPDEWLTIRDAMIKWGASETTTRRNFELFEEAGKLERFIAPDESHAWRRGPKLQVAVSE